MKKLLSDPVMVKWLEVCDPYMQPFEDAPEGVCEVEMQKVFYLE